MKKTSYKVALGGVIASLALFCMFCTSLAPFLTYAAPMFAGTLMIIMVVEISYSWAFLTYAAISVLSLFITPDKEAAMLFIFLLGYYPIMKALIEKIRKPVVEWLIKFVLFNASTISCYWLIINLFNMQEVFDSLNDFGRYSIPIFIGAANIVFVIYDLFLNTMALSYVNWFRPKFLRKINK